MKVRIEEDPETGDLFIKLPEEVLEELELEIGDQVTWTLYEDGSVLLTA